MNPSAHVTIHHGFVRGDASLTDLISDAYGFGTNGQVFTSAGPGQPPQWAAAGITTPVSVPNGGTGDTSLTAYAVLCGGATSTGAVQSIAGVGSSGQVLTSNGAGALPTFQANPAVSAIQAFWISQLAVTVANTASETTLLDTGIGTKIVPSVIGGSDGCARIRAKGYWSTIAVSPGTITISLNASTNVLATTGAVSVPVSLSGTYWELEIDLDFNPSGINVMGRFTIQGAANAQFIYGLVNTSTNDGSHLTNPLNLQVTWSVANAGNSITMFTCDFCAGVA
jgi:hypothetical protein